MKSNKGFTPAARMLWAEAETEAGGGGTITVRSLVRGKTCRRV